MNGKFNFLKASLVGLFLTSAIQTSADVFYVCQGTSLNIQADNLEPGATPVWDITDGSNTIDGFIPTTAIQLTHVFNTSGTYHVVLSQTSTELCTSDPVEHIVHVLPAFTVTISDPASYCIQNASATTTTLTASVNPSDDFTAPGVTYSYQWFESDVSNTQGSVVGTNQTLDIPGNSVAGDYYYTVEVVYSLNSSAEGAWLGIPCEDVADTPAHIEALPTPAAPTITITAN